MEIVIFINFIRPISPKRCLFCPLSVIVYRHYVTHTLGHIHN